MQSASGVPSVRSDSVLGVHLLRALDERGLSAEALGRLELPPDAAARDNVPLTPDELRWLAAEASRRLRDPLLGLHIAQRLARGAYAVLEFITRSAGTLRQALDAMVQFQRLSGQGAALSLHDEGGLVAIEQPGEADFRLRNEFRLGLLLAVARQVTPSALAPARLWFAHPRPEEAVVREWQAHAGTPLVEFDRQSTGLQISASVLDAAIPGADPALHQVLASHARRRLSELPEEGNFLGAVRTAARAAFEEGPPSLEGVAAALAVSTRTLQRRLAEHEVTFNEVLEELREQRARSLLEGTTLGIAEIGYRVGYADPRTFSRAFKRWTGATPGDYRKRRT